MKKLCIVTNIPNPYRIPLFNELNKELINKNISLKVIFGAEGYQRRKWNLNKEEFLFDHSFLPSKKISFGNEEKILFTYSGLIKELNKYKPDIIIVIGFSIASFKILFWCKLNKKKYIIWSGSIENNYRKKSMFRLLQRKFLIKRASAFIAYGTKAKEYLISIGAQPEKVFIAINTVDTEFFIMRTEEEKNKIKDENNLYHITYIGHLVPRKNVIKILETVLELKNSRNDFILDIIGDGEERGKLELYTKEMHLNDFVEFHGFKQKNEIPYYLAQSNCFLFQTDFDIWGLVLVEAMVSRIPCISSINAGATDDLIFEGETGFKADFEDTKYVTEKIKYIFENPDKAKQIGLNAQKFIMENVSIKNSVDGFMKAIESI